MEPENKSQKRATPASFTGALWFGGWLFTIGFAKLMWWKILLGLVAWPYFLGASLAAR